MLQIIPIKDLKDILNVSKLCHKKNEPIYITKMVIELSEEQIKNGKTKDAKKSLKSVRDKYDLLTPSPSSP